MIKAIHIFHDCMGACVQLDGGDFLAWFNVCQGLRQSPLLFNIFFATVIIVVLQRFAEDLLIVSDLVYLDDAPKGEDGRSREEGTSGNGPASGVGDAVCRRCGGGVDIASWSYQDDGRYSCRMSGIRTDSVGKKIPRPCTCGPIPIQRRTRCELRRQGNGVNKRPRLCTLVVLSARARTLTPRLSVASAPLGECQKIQFRIVRPTERPAVVQDQAIRSGGNGSCAVRMCHVDYALSGL